MHTVNSVERLTQMVAKGLEAVKVGNMELASQYAQDSAILVLFVTLFNPEGEQQHRKLFYPLALATHEYRFGHPINPELWGVQ